MENNMKIKMKVANDASDVLVACPDCDKKFSCGKALEGHKRAHLEKSTNKRDHEAMEASSAAVVDVAEETGGEKPTFPCPICPQLFPSEKALHGHMRKHSDRGWRGMNPPAEAPPAPDGDYHAVGSGDGDTSPLEQPQRAGNGDDGVGGENRKKLKQGFPFDLNELPPPDEDDVETMNS